jgi:malonyl-CoA decarboxylase
MLQILRTSENAVALLEWVQQDPVHAFTETRTLFRRTKSDRDIFYWMENDVPAAVLCVAYTVGLPDTISQILDNTSEIVDIAESTHAIFYTVFKTDAPTEVQNPGAKLIRSAAKWIKDNVPSITDFVTMSPVPALTQHFTNPPTRDEVAEFINSHKDPVAKFHLRNGAKLRRVIECADNSERRTTQSFGIMVNYDYTGVQL